MVSKEQVVSAVCDVMGVCESDLMGRNLDRAISKPRQMAMYLVCDLLNVSSTFCGVFFKRDHTTVLYALKIMEQRLETNEPTREAYRRILERLSDMKQQVAA